MLIRQIFPPGCLNEISVENPGLDTNILVKSLTFPNFPTAPSLISSSAEEPRWRYWDGAAFSYSLRLAPISPKLLFQTIDIFSGKYCKKNSRCSFHISYCLESLLVVMARFFQFWPPPRLFSVHLPRPFVHLVTLECRYLSNTDLLQTYQLRLVLIAVLSAADES